MHSDDDSLNTSRREQPAPALRGLALPVASSSLGTESSNTVPSTGITDTPTKVLRAGIDSLYLTFQGEMFADSGIKLKRLKELAQGDTNTSTSLAQYPVGEHVFEVSGNGRNPFAYVLTDGWYRIELAKPTAKLLPMAYCRINSEVLTLLGAKRAVDDLTKLISQVGALSDLANVSRADLCVDFVTSHPMHTLKIKDFVGKARDFNKHTVGRRFSGLSIAPGGLMSARLYSKTLEMKKKPRPYLEDLWRQLGWDGEQEVWRLEFQFRRQVLRDLEIVKYEHFAGSLAGLWRYATQDWLRHTVPSPTDTKQTRWPASELWTALQSVPWSGIDQLQRVNLERSRIPADRTLFVNGLSPLTSYMAREGILDAGEAVTAFFRAAQDFHDSDAAKTGVDFENYVSAKVAEKRRFYNTGRNKPLDEGIHPADKAVSDEYRKRSDGEY